MRICVSKSIICKQLHQYDQYLYFVVSTAIVIKIQITTILISIKPSRSIETEWIFTHAISQLILNTTAYSSILIITTYICSHILRLSVVWFCLGSLVCSHWFELAWLYLIDLN